MFINNRTEWINCKMFPLRKIIQQEQQNYTRYDRSHKQRGPQRQPPPQGLRVWCYLYKVQNIQRKADLICNDRRLDSGCFGEVACCLGGGTRALGRGWLCCTSWSGHRLHFLVHSWLPLPRTYLMLHYGYIPEITLFPPSISLLGGPSASPNS